MKDVIEGFVAKNNVERSASFTVFYAVVSKIDLINLLETYYFLVLSLALVFF